MVMQSEKLAPWKITAKTQPTTEISSTPGMAGIFKRATTMMNSTGSSKTGLM